jgi:RNA polymerase sigma factor (sigma-70 family)
MMNGGTGVIMRRIRQMAVGRTGAGLTDRQLLEDFISRSDGDAFETLVRRHGAMVLRVGRRVLSNQHDAEDVFQSTFLTLACRATSVRKQDSLAAWLYGVAYRVAMNARRHAARRQAGPKSRTGSLAPDPLVELTGRELCDILDEELIRLPEKCRAPWVLCHLEGKTRDEAAQELRVSLATLKRRLEEGRELLRARLSKRGIALSAAISAAAISEASASAGLIPALVLPTVKAAVSTAAGTASAGVVSPKVALMTKEVLTAMFMCNLKNATALVLLCAAFTAGVGTFALHTHAAGEKRAKSEVSAILKEADVPKKDKELLQGRWIVSSAEHNGQADGDLKDAKLIFAVDRFHLVVNDEEKFKVNPASSTFGLHVGTFKLDPGKDPKEIDLAQGETVVVPGIYSLDGDTLKVCVKRGAERPTGFNATEGAGTTLLVLKREQKGEEKQSDQSTKSPPRAENTERPTGVKTMRFLPLLGWADVDSLSPAENSGRRKGDKENKLKTDADKLQGIWTGTVVEVSGTARRSKSPVQLFIKENKLTLRGPTFGVYIGFGIPQDNKFGFTLDDKKQPKSLDLTFPKGPDDLNEISCQGIYTLDGDDLKLCLAVFNKKRPTEFKTQDKSAQILIELKRDAKATWEELPKLQYAAPPTN